jgi:ribosome maturation factor RimP
MREEQYARVHEIVKRVVAAQNAVVVALIINEHGIGKEVKILADKGQGIRLDECAAMNRENQRPA